MAETTLKYGVVGRSPMLRVTETTIEFPIRERCRHSRGHRSLLTAFWCKWTMQDKARHWDWEVVVINHG